MNHHESSILCRHMHCAAIELGYVDPFTTYPVPFWRRRIWSNSVAIWPSKAACRTTSFSTVCQRLSPKVSLQPCATNTTSISEGSTSHSSSFICKTWSYKADKAIHSSSISAISPTSIKTILSSTSFSPTILSSTSFSTSSLSTAAVR